MDAWIAPLAALVALLAAGAGLMAGRSMGAAPLRALLAARDETIERLEGELRAVRATLQGRDAELRDARAGLQDAQLDAARLDAELEAQRSAQGQLEVRLADAQAQLRDTFTSLAQTVLDEKATAFATRNAEGMERILAPFRDRLEQLRRKVEESYDTEARERFSLRRELEQLVTMNRQLSDDARGLADALRGKAQLQGAWGELVLERLLESAGLERGREFRTQWSVDDEEAGRRRPDAVLYLPEDRHLVIDAKVSLVAYERWCGCGDDSSAAGELKLHVASLRTHLLGLAERRYEALKGLNTPDFTLMFVPIEGAFSAALRGDERLFQEAFHRKVLIVSPTTLLVVLKMVSHLWRQDKIGRSTREIVEQGRLVYEKVRGFLVDFEQVGRQLKGANERWDAARLKLADGKGSLVAKVEKLTELGVSPTQRIGAQWLAAGQEPEAAGDAADTVVTAEPEEPAHPGVLPMAVDEATTRA